MEKHKHELMSILCLGVVVSLGLFSVASSVAAEFHRAKLKDLKLDGRLCYLPRSPAFCYGISALVFWSTALMIGNLTACYRRNCCSAKAPMISTFLLSISWISFGIGALLLGSATSMSKRQPYGTGWLDSECYVVKDGIFIGSAILAFLSTASLLLASATSTLVDPESTVHQQLNLQQG